MFLLLTALLSGSVAIDLRECRRALGMESGAIRDAQITASSSYNEEYAGPQHGRAGVESGSGAWCPAGQISATSREFIEIDLREPTLLAGVKTMGRYDDGRGNEFARFYRVEYWRASLGEWKRLVTGDLHEILQGNTDTRSPHTTWIEGAIVVEKVRILPVSNTTRTICMRVELYGCPYRESLSSYSLLRDGDAADGLDLRDARFDGPRKEDGRLVKGIGKLYDGLLGFEDHESHPDRWVGWRSRGEGEQLQITVDFAARLNLSAVLLHTSNYRRYNAQIFTAILLEFSINGVDFSSPVLSLPYDSDSFENLRWVRLPVPHRLTKTLRITLRLPPRPHWLLLSELQFESDGAPLSLPASPDTVPVTTVHLVTPQLQQPAQQQQGSALWLLLLAAAAAAAAALAALCCCSRRRGSCGSRGVKSSSPSLSAHLFSQHVVLMEDGTMKTIVSPSTYAMARDNRTNELIEKIPLGCGEDEDDLETIYADPDSLEEDLCSSALYRAPLLCSSTATTLSMSMRRGTHLPSTPLVPIPLLSDCASAYSTLLPAISRAQIEFIRPIGQGEFGKVHLARLERRRLVAVKSLHGRDAAAEAALEQEVRVLGALRHPNVVEVIGVIPAEGDTPMGCVMHFMARGDLKRHLTTRPVDAPTALAFCVQIAAGMSYLESRSYVHRDVAARNCLLDEDLTVRIGDFGMARSLYADEYYRVEGECRVPVRWMAPESLLLGKFSSASDVWAFAVTCWEVLTRADRLPYPTLTHEEVVARLARPEGLILECPQNCPEWLYRELLLPCWSVDASLRPTFQAIHHYLQSAQHKARY